MFWGSKLLTDLRENRTVVLEFFIEFLPVSPAQSCFLSLLFSFSLVKLALFSLCPVLEKTFAGATCDFSNNPNIHLCEHIQYTHPHPPTHMHTHARVHTRYLCRTEVCVVARLQGIIQEDWSHHRAYRNAN